jgi:small-conductance mechanosensitive channel
MKEFLTPTVLSHWQVWLQPTVLILLATLAAFCGHALLWASARRLVRYTATPFDDILVVRLYQPMRVMFISMSILLVLPVLFLPPSGIDLIRHLGALGLIGATTWAVVALIEAANDFALMRYRLDVSDNLWARQFHTRFRILRRLTFVGLGILSGSAMLMTFPSVRHLGTSLLASAGLTGLVLGIAARPALSNLIAGFQLAFAEPIRIDDVVIVEGEWGRIEEITTTYVVVRIWDLRRLVVPLSYFIENPFQNWTRVSADLLGTVYVYADYTVPVEEVRQALLTLLKSSGMWDGKVWGLQVTNANEHTVELRALMSAQDSATAWNLRCYVREKLIELLQQRYAGSLPRIRAEFHKTSPS